MEDSLQGEKERELSDVAPSAPAWLTIAFADVNANTAITAEEDHAHLTIYNLKDQTLLKMFQYVNYTDMLQLRLVNRHFCEIISSSQAFLDSTCLVIPMDSYEPVHKESCLNTHGEYQHVRFEKIDYCVFQKQKEFQPEISANCHFPSSEKVLPGLKSLAFRMCFLTWERIRLIVRKTPTLEELSLDHCQILTGDATIMSKYDEFQVGNIFHNLKAIKIHEYRDLEQLNWLLENLVGYRSSFLEKIGIAFSPEERVDEPGVPLRISSVKISRFYDHLHRILEINASSLRRLVLNLNSTSLLNGVWSNVLGRMKNLGAELRLEELSLNSWTQGSTMRPNSASITEKGLESFDILIGLLASQTNLKSAGIPNISCSQWAEEKRYRRRLAEYIPTSVEHLRVPNEDFLPTDFQERFRNLKKLYIGGAVSVSNIPIQLSATMFKSRTIVTAQPQGGSQPDQASGELSNNYLDQLKELSLGTSIVNGLELLKTIEQFRFLVKFEMSSPLAVFQDEDLQCCIVSLPLLQVLTIASSVYITDFGVSGIRRITCEMMVRLSNYHQLDDSIMDQGNGNSGISLSKLKGLRHLSLKGCSCITDVGIHFGLRFQELQTAWLPYNIHITEWGIRQFGRHNPSLDKFTVSALNRRSRESFMELKKRHPRIRKIKCQRNGDEDGMPDDFSANLASFDEVKTDLTNYVQSFCMDMNVFGLFGQRSELAETGVQTTSNAADFHDPDS